MKQRIPASTSRPRRSFLRSPLARTSTSPATTKATSGRDDCQSDDEVGKADVAGDPYDSVDEFPGPDPESADRHYYDLPYREEFRELATEWENFHFVPCPSRESYLTDWDGESDYIQHALMRYVDADEVTAPVGTRLDDRLERVPRTEESPRLDPSNMEVYACGITAMVYGLVEAVERLGDPEERIESEGFG